MLKSIRWDIYTIIMVALVPGVLLAAWGLLAREDHQIKSRQCEVAVEWLEQSAVIAPQFTVSSRMDQTSVWLATFQEINAPAAAGRLRNGIISSANYHISYYPTMATDGPAVLNPRNGLWSREVDEGIEDLIEHCPETEALIPDAFPMVVEEEQPN